MATSRTKGSKLKGKAGGAIRKAARKIASALTPKKPLNRGSKAAKKTAAASASDARGTAKKASAPRKVQRKSDIDPGELATMVPTQQSSRGPFDKRRGERQRDAEALEGVSNSSDRWAEEDRETNRTGDKRIGTRRRKAY